MTRIGSGVLILPSFVSSSSISYGANPPLRGVEIFVLLALRASEVTEGDLKEAIDTGKAFAPGGISPPLSTMTGVGAALRRAI